MTTHRFTVLLAALSLAAAPAALAQTGPGWGAGPGWGMMQQMPPGSGYGPQGPFGGLPWGGGPQGMMGGGMMAPGDGWGGVLRPMLPWAGQGGPQGPMMGMGWPGGRDPNAPGRGRFALVDADEDGTITAEEAASHADMVFAAIDADDDGVLTPDEYMAVRMGPDAGLNPARAAAMQALRAARFDPMDSDGDGTVSRAEFMAAAQAHFAEAAAAASDGRVTPWTYRSRAWN